MKKTLNLLFIITGLVILVSGTTEQKTRKHAYIGPQAIIYKTNGDYAKNVPVTLSADKSKIVSYPAPQDLYFDGKLAYPTELKDHYWLDNRGIGPNTAFIKMTYEEYSKLTSAPAVDELYKMIIDKDPITHMYSLGVRYKYKNIVPQIDSLIEHHHLKEFKKLK